VTPPYPRVVLATGNAHKATEVRRILTGAGVHGVDILDLREFPDAPQARETGITFAQNAVLKARAVSEATGLPAIADDSGLCVDVLGGSPGIFSARWAGRHGDDEANLLLLLKQLVDVPDEHRGAAFVCAAALVVPGQPELVLHGQVTGVVTTHVHGTDGFGYDPVFRPEGEQRTTAQLSAAEKDQISHRGRAFRLLAPYLDPGSAG
jgi:XTP/dITP diphosphohydrolase